MGGAGQGWGTTRWGWGWVGLGETWLLSLPLQIIEPYNTLTWQPQPLRAPLLHFQRAEGGKGGACALVAPHRLNRGQRCFQAHLWGTGELDITAGAKTGARAKLAPPCLDHGKRSFQARQRGESTCGWSSMSQNRRVCTA